VNKRNWILTLIGLLLLGNAVIAQDTTGTDTDTDNGTDTETAAPGEASTINWFFVACENSAVVDLTGFMEPGFDVYVQIFRELGASGEPLTPLQQVSVSGDYQISPTLNYNNGQVLALGQFASARLSIAREGSPSNAVFTSTVDDVQDGCVTPTYDPVDTTIADEDGGTAGGGDQVGQVTRIYSPFGGIINPNIVAELPPENLVQIGARPSLQPFFDRQRSETFGLIFAECDAFPGSQPGLLYDTDELTVFWSWFAETPELVEEHIRQARYQLWFNSEWYPPQNIIDEARRSEIVQREDGNYWVFYTIPLGDWFAPGEYSIGYRVEWAEPISDGFEEFGPNTANPFLENRCHFQVEKNPWGTEREYKNPNFPLNLP